MCVCVYTEVEVEVDRKKYTFNTEKPVWEIFKPFDVFHIKDFAKQSSKNSKLFVFLIDHGNILSFSNNDFLYYISRIQFIPRNHTYFCCTSCHSGSFVLYVNFADKYLKIYEMLKEKYLLLPHIEQNYNLILEFILFQRTCDTDNLNDIIQQFFDNTSNSPDFTDILLSHTREEYEELYLILHKLKIKTISHTHTHS